MGSDGFACRPLLPHFCCPEPQGLKQCSHMSCISSDKHVHMHIHTVTCVHYTFDYLCPEIDFALFCENSCMVHRCLAPSGQAIAHVCSIRISHLLPSLLLLAPQLPRRPSAMKQPPQRSLPCAATCCCTVSGMSPGEKHAETEIEPGHQHESEVINHSFNTKGND